MKQLCTLKVLLVALWCLSVSVKSYAEVYSGSCGESVNWSLDTETGLLEITGWGKMEDNPWNDYRSYIRKCTIGYWVTSIGNSAFSGCTRLTSITIGNRVTSIGDDAFYGCTGLTSMTIPESVTSIGNSAFSSCTRLTSITIGNSVKSIGNSAFSGCTGLTNITLPNSVTSIGSYAFSHCTGLTNITLPNSVTSIGNCAFIYCTGLTSITISEGVTSIGYATFSGCTGLTSITIPEGVTSIGFRAFYCCTGLTSMTIPESVTSIEADAFRGCTGLTSITIGNSVTSIGEYAFIGCDNLKTVINLSNLNITEGSVDNGYVAYYADKVIKADTQIDDFCFEDRTDGNYLIYYIGKETELTLPENYQGGSYGIGDYVFNNCTGLTSITIGNSVTSIGEYAFRGCTGLTSITIGNSVTSIGDGAFSNCTGLTSITIPESVTSIGSYAFYCCTGLTSITIPNSVTSIGEYAFSSCTGLTSITIGNSVTSIGSYAFYYCIGLTSIAIPEGVTSIGSHAFANCGNLKAVINLSNLNITEGSVDNGYVAYRADKVIKPDTQIDDFFFEDRTDGNYLVYYVGNETELTLPENYQGGSYGIGDYAFNNCTRLTSITIGNSVTSIGEYAFIGCTNIKTIYCRSQEPPVCGNSALDGIDTWDCTLFVPEGAEALYKVADQWKDFFFIEEITGIDTPRADDGKDTTYDIYDMSGRTVRKAATTTDGLKPGLYIINGRKVLVE